MKHLNTWITTFKPVNMVKSTEPLSRNLEPTRPKINTFMRFAEADCGIISSRNIKIIEGHGVVNFEVASLVLSEIFQKDSSGGINAICSRPEVADYVISVTDVYTFWYYACVNLWVAIFSNLLVKKIYISHLCNAKTTAGSPEPHFRGQGANMSMHHRIKDEALNHPYQNCKPFWNGWTVI